ncbi:MAG: RNA-binding S4 domain-containing protein [Oscillospiraceae bacterium]|nr:RNA-binding S4 domain-containing protein [Oscillospiraceae bacterium]
MAKSISSNLPIRVALPGVRRVFIKSEFIKLDSLLKFASIASTGGEAKILIQNGDVLVGGEVCTLRGKKIKPGDVVRCGTETLVVKQAN